MAKELAAELKQKAEEKAPFNEELRALFQTLPNTLEELDEAIEDAKARADMSYSTNPQIIAEYEKRCKEVNKPNQIKSNQTKPKKNDVAYVLCKIQIEELEGKLQGEQKQLDIEVAKVEELKVFIISLSLILFIIQQQTKNL